jgi:RNA polymerase sigma-70 factor (ECF subfamily)
MSDSGRRSESEEATALAAAIRGGDEPAFDRLAAGRRRELLVHCYRMLGSLDDAEDAVQEALLRAWRYRESLKEGMPLRPWLYRIATNVCLDSIARDERRSALAAKVGEGGAAATIDEVAWIQPLPDAVIEPISPRDADPEAIALRRETIELAFLAVIQLLTPQQRAALILCDVLGWPSREAAALLETSPASVNSLLQRARSTLARKLPARRPQWPPGADPSAAERELLRRYVEAGENADLHALTALLREDATFRMPPDPEAAVGRDEILRVWAEGGFGTEAFGRLRCVLTRANLQPAVACYVLQPGDSTWRALAIDVLRIEEGVITEIVTFPGDIFPRFDLPLILEPRSEAEKPS